MTDMKPDAYISDLLYQYDCVIIPDFGGFVGNFAPAQVHPVHHKFYPPSKKISFNRNLKNNDGLLANQIAMDLGITFEEAVGQIRKAVAEYKQRLNEGETIEIRHVGRLFHDTEGNLRFDPDRSSNFLSSSYGLRIFQALPVKREAVVRQLDTEVIEKTAQSVRSSGTMRKLGVAAAVAAVLTLTLVTGYNNNWGSHIEQAYSSMNPFGQSDTPQYHPQVMELESIAEVEHRVIEPMLDEQEHEAWVSMDLSDEESIGGMYVHNGKAPEEKESPATAESVAQYLPYHVVGGCFSVKANAHKLTRRLKRSGYDAAIVGQHKGLYVVSYQSFATKWEAKKALTRIQADHNAQAWVLKK